MESNLQLTKTVLVGQRLEKAQAGNFVKKDVAANLMGENANLGTEFF